MASLRAKEFCSCKDLVDNDIPPSINGVMKAAVLRVSPSIVSVITHNVPDDMVFKRIRINPNPLKMFKNMETHVCPGSGIVIQSKEEGDGIYVSTIICPANLFRRTNALGPHQIKVDVRVSGGKLYKGEVETCDFYYNLAVVKIQSNSPLQPAIIRHMSDVMSDVDSNQHLQLHEERAFKLRRHSKLTLFKVQLGTEIMTAERSWADPYNIIISAGVFSTRGGLEMHRQELFSIKGSKQKLIGGGAVINYYGEVIGICLSNAAFLPFNLVSRWWDHFKSCGEFLRPYLGVDVADLHEADTDFYDQFIRKFPNILTGVVVTEVVENSPAHEFGIKRDDVIIYCNDNLKGSKLEFFEKVWDNPGRVVELKVIKASGGGEHLENLNLTIGDAAPDESYEWELPDCRKLSKCIT